MKNKGFTLIELLVVIAIVGVLATIIMANFSGVRTRARDAERKADLSQLQAAFELHRADRGTYPTAPLPACNTALAVSGTTYIAKVPCDPSTNTSYTYSTTGSTYQLRTCLENTNDPQKDATNTGCAAGTTSYTVTNP
jgi:type II secretion system protein G